MRCGILVFSFRGGLRAGCASISTRAQYVTPVRKKILKKSKCAGLAQEISFSALNSCCLLCSGW